VRILYLGLPLGALRLIGAGHLPVAACIGHPEAPGMRRVRRLLGGRGVLLLGRPDLDDPEVKRAIASAQPDVLLSWFWPKRIPEDVLALAPRGGYGVHPSLLPRWRGPDPYFWAVRTGDRVTGVTLHRLASDYDTGAILQQRRLRIRATDDSWKLARRLDRPSLELLVDCASRLARGDLPAGRPQDDAEATHAPRPSEDDLAIDWKAPADEVLRLVRAAGPLPGATALIGDHPVEIVRARRARSIPRALIPAEACVARAGVVVKAQDDGVLLVEVRTDDGRTLRGREVRVLLSEA
jgi:methionyl-tRNA formyltransferase